MIQAYKNTKDRTGKQVTLPPAIQRIIDGKRELAEKTRTANRLAETDKEAYKKYKEENLPAVTFSGIFPPGNRKAAHLIKHSGYITLDIDGLPTDTIPDLMADFAENTHVRLAFISPSRRGVVSLFGCLLCDCGGYIRIFDIYE